MTDSDRHIAVLVREDRLHEVEALLHDLDTAAAADTEPSQECVRYER